MDPTELEFLAENGTVSIIPNFSHPTIFLISGDVGPFRAGMPIKVPIWLAINLKSRQKCRLIAPDWMDVEQLEALREEEKKATVFCPMPSEYYILEAQMLLNVADGDIPRADALRTVIKDLWDIRLAKLRTSVHKFVKEGAMHAQINHLTSMEINSIRPLLPHTIDLINRYNTNIAVGSTQNDSVTPLSN